MSQDASPTEPAPGDPATHELRVAVIASRWYPEVMARLRAGALATLQAAGVPEENIELVEVPGAFELPLAATWVTRLGRVQAVVALGCVVRGETPHFDHVARAAVDGLMRAAQDSGVPVGLGVITADTRAQAEARSRAPEGGTVADMAGNKGVEAADAALRMASLLRRLEG